jgi:hypothetical protein
VIALAFVHGAGQGFIGDRRFDLGLAGQSTDRSRHWWRRMLACGLATRLDDLVVGLASLWTGGVSGAVAMGLSCGGAWTGEFCA